MYWIGRFGVACIIKMIEVMELVSLRRFFCLVRWTRRERYMECFKWIFLLFIISMQVHWGLSCLHIDKDSPSALSSPCCKLIVKLVGDLNCLTVSNTEPSHFFFISFYIVLLSTYHKKKLGLFFNNHKLIPICII